MTRGRWKSRAARAGPPGSPTGSSGAAGISRRRSRNWRRYEGIITREVADYALKALEVDEHGLDEMDKRILLCIIEKYAGGPVGVNTLAVAVGEEPGTIEEVYEPYLIQEGFIKRTPRGREATSLAYEHFHLRRPGGSTQVTLSL